MIAFGWTALSVENFPANVDTFKYVKCSNAKAIPEHKNNCKKTMNRFDRVTSILLLLQTRLVVTAQWLSKFQAG